MGGQQLTLRRSWTLYLSMLAAFYAVWLAIVVADHAWSTVLQGWPIALAMALGSFVAGSTPMGGGTIGFPVLVLGFDFPSSLGRDFGFAIQSVGMVSASAFILVRRQPLEWRMLRPALIGSALGTPLGLLFIAPFVAGSFVKIVFAVLWASFGLVHLAKMKEIIGSRGRRVEASGFDRKAGFLIGLLGGAFVASLTAVGVDMLIYTVLVLLCRGDIKVAIPTSVLLMAFTSVVGVSTQAVLGRLDSGLSAHWLAAAPIVAIGAPFGSLVVGRLGRETILFVVSLLCLLQFAWTMHHEHAALGESGLVMALGALGVTTLAFLVLEKRGISRARPKAVASSDAPLLITPRPSP